MEKHAFLEPLLYDMLLVLLFVTQHSIMATDWWKDILDDFGLRHITRSIYCFVTSVALQVGTTLPKLYIQIDKNTVKMDIR